MSNYKQGIFKPKNPEKYAGNANNIVYRSSWEMKVFLYLDAHPDVIYWASEELSINYFNPVEQRIRRYFPDLIFKVKEKDGNIKTYMIEIKPYIQTIEPTEKRKTQNFINKVKTYAVNKNKWKAAEIFCEEKGWTFKIITEKNLQSLL